MPRWRRLKKEQQIEVVSEALPAAAKQFQPRSTDVAMWYRRSRVRSE